MRGLDGGCTITPADIACEFPSRTTHYVRTGDGYKGTQIIGGNQRREVELRIPRTLALRSPGELVAVLTLFGLL